LKTYKQLTCEQRYAIKILKEKDFLQKDIAAAIGVNKSTISRELKRNSGKRGYRPKQAQQKAVERRRDKSPPRIGKDIWDKVKTKIEKDWSPEQISGRLKETEDIRISHEWIYQFIIKDRQTGGDLYTHLRCRSKRKKRYGSQESRGTIKNRRSIEERPAVVETKERIGDWEADTIIGKAHKGAIVSLTERKTKLCLIYNVERKTSDLVKKAMSKLLLPLKEVVYTITSDNGKEFAMHEETAKTLETDFYFAHPYASYERGLNENTNGLIRQYFPKDRDFRTITDEEIMMAMKKLNNRPRKTLGFLTPNEVFFENYKIALTT
jgi:transposase, IS30 family